MLYRHCFFNVALDFAIRRVQINQDGLKSNCTHQLLFHADYVNILGGSEHNIKEKVELLILASKELGIEVNADKTKYTVIYRHQNAVRRQNMKIDNSYFGRVEEFKYLATTLRSQNSVLNTYLLHGAESFFRS
jgi:hypothetical protein